MSQNPFDQKKELIISEIESTNETNTDASPKGTIDELCLPIIHLINSHKDMVTTSSCSGRLSVFLEGIKNVESQPVSEEAIKIGSKGNQGHWIYITHNKTEVADWYKKQDFRYTTEYPVENNTRYILYKYEPLILHVKCRDVESAGLLYKTAMNCGFRETGMGINNIVAIRISIKLDIPIGYLDEKTDELKVFVEEQYLSLIDKLTLDRFKENEKKLNQLYKAIEDMSNLPEQEHIETKEERRERKKREGLAKQMAKKVLLADSPIDAMTQSIDKL